LLDNFANGRKARPRALASVERAFELGPDVPYTLYFQGMILLQMERYDDAIAAMEDGGDFAAQPGSRHPGAGKRRSGTNGAKSEAVRRLNR